MSNTLDDFNQIRRKVNKDYGSKNVVSFDFGVKKKTSQTKSQTLEKPKTVVKSQTNTRPKEVAKTPVMASRPRMVGSDSSKSTNLVDKSQVRERENIHVAKEKQDSRVDDKANTKKTEEFSQTVMSDLAEELSEIPEVSPTLVKKRSLSVKEEPSSNVKQKDKAKKVWYKDKSIVMAVVGVFCLTILIVVVSLNMIMSHTSSEVENEDEEQATGEEVVSSPFSDENETLLPLQHDALEDQSDSNKEALGQDIEVKIGEYEKLGDEAGGKGAVQVSVKNISDKTISATVEILAKDDGGNILDFANLYAECMEPGSPELLFQAFLASELTEDQLRSSKFEISRASLYTPPSGECGA